MIELDKNNSSQYTLEIERLRNQLIELSSHQSKLKDIMDKFTDDIQVLINELRNQSVNSIPVVTATYDRITG